MSGSSQFEAMGGEATLRTIVDDFVDRVCDDVMIGFFFRNVDRSRLKEMEYQFAAQFLGANVAYEGRPLREAHAAHPIMGGQFGRRKKILEETLLDHHVQAAIIESWLEHTERLRPLITGDSGTDCDEEKASARLVNLKMEQSNDD